MSYQRFFITGLPRSGTTWLMNLMNHIPGVRCLGQGYLFGTAVRDVPSLYRSIQSGIRDWAQLVACRKGNVLRTDDAIKTIGRENVLIADEIVSAEAERYADVAIKAIVEAMLPIEVERIGEKTPLVFEHDLRKVVELNPDALIICMSRNVHDWIVSWARFYYERRVQKAPVIECIPFDDADYLRLHKVFTVGRQPHFLRPGRLVHLARMWQHMRFAMVDAAQRENVMHLPYIQLYTYPEETLTSILSFLAIGTRDRIVDAIEACKAETFGSTDQGRNHIHAAAPGENKRLLSDEDVEIIDRVIKE